MKMIHALVGYLAVTALPLHLFAFGSPLINYDGYVNTTQNLIDGALMKRVPGDIIEARQEEIIVPVVGVIINIVVVAFISVVWIENDEPVRGQ